MDVKRSRSSGLGSFSFSLVGLVGLLAVIVAGATVWLLLTDPVTVAESESPPPRSAVYSKVSRLPQKPDGGV